MSWASRHIVTLREKGVAEFRPRGNSMEPIIHDNELVRVIALDTEEGTRALAYHDVVLCVVKGRYYLHLVKAIEADRVLIGNNRGVLNGWTPIKHVFGKVVWRERDCTSFGMGIGHRGSPCQYCQTEK